MQNSKRNPIMTFLYNTQNSKFFLRKKNHQVITFPKVKGGGEGVLNAKRKDRCNICILDNGENKFDHLL